MKIIEAFKIVQARKQELEKELLEKQDRSNKRMILMNLDSCEQMLMYLHLLDKGINVKFKIVQDNYAPQRIINKALA